MSVSLLDWVIQRLERIFLIEILETIDKCSFEQFNLRDIVDIQ